MHVGINGNSGYGQTVIVSYYYQSQNTTHNFLYGQAVLPDVGTKANIDLEIELEIERWSFSALRHKN